MKKLIAVLAVSAIVTTVAFAQVAVSGTVETRLNLLHPNLGDEDTDMTIGGTMGAAQIQLAGTNADGTLGGLFRLRNTDIVRADPWFHRVFVWWRPIQPMRIWLGIDQDGMFDTAHFAGWGFHQGDNDYMFNHQWDFWRRIFPGNWDGFGLAFSFTNFGVDGLALNLVLPTGGRNWPQATNAQVTRRLSIQEMLAGFRFHGTYTIPGVGTLQFVYNAPGGIMNIDDPLSGDPNCTVALNQVQTTWGDATNMGQAGLSFLLTALDFGNILFGGAVVIPDADRFMDAHAGLALDMPSLVPGTMGLRFRVGANISGNNFDPTFITGNIMPVIAMGPGSLMFDLGLSVAVGAVDGDDESPTYRESVDFSAEQHLGWSVKPVYRLPLASGAFSIGLHISSGVNMGGNAGLTGNNNIRLNIPMLLRFAF